MKIHKIIILLALCVISCRTETKSTVAKETVTLATDSVQQATNAGKPIYESSTFISTKDHFDVRNDLRELNNAGVFDSIHPTQMAKLSDIHYAALKSLGRNYKLLYIADGSLFAPGNKDKAIVAYQPDKEYLAILLYNDSNKSMGELYGDYKVENGLENAGCNYGAFGTLDFQLASEIIYIKKDLLENPESLLRSTLCVITDFTKDENYVPDVGCFSPKVPQLTGNVLCIATSLIYNNWECLKYNKDTDSFLICYGQAFAD